MKKQSVKSIFILSTILVIMILITSFSGAWFTSSKTVNNITELRFGSVRLTSTPSLSFTQQELIPGNSPTKNLTITNTGTVDIYVRFKVEITIDGEPAVVTKGDSTTVNLISYNTGLNSPWVIQNGEWYFYTDDVISPGVSNAVSLTLNFVINEAFGSDINANTVQIDIILQSVQSANNGGVVNNEIDYSSIEWSQSN